MPSGEMEIMDDLKRRVASTEHVAVGERHNPDEESRWDVQLIEKDLANGKTLGASKAIVSSRCMDANADRPTVDRDSGPVLVVFAV